MKFEKPHLERCEEEEIDKHDVGCQARSWHAYPTAQKVMFKLWADNSRVQDPSSQETRGRGVWAKRIKRGNIRRGVVILRKNLARRKD